MDDHPIVPHDHAQPHLTRETRVEGAGLKAFDEVTQQLPQPTRLLLPALLWELGQLSCLWLCDVLHRRTLKGGLLDIRWLLLFLCHVRSPCWPCRKARELSVD